MLTSTAVPVKLIHALQGRIKDAEAFRQVLLKIGAQDSRRQWR